MAMIKNIVQCHNFVVIFLTIMSFDFKEICTVTLILFAVIDMPGAIPIFVNLRNKIGTLHARRTTIASGILRLGFLFVGDGLLKLIGIDVSSFALAGSLVIFIIALEMILGIDIMKIDPETKSTSIVPLAFPIIAGAGTLTTLLSIKPQFAIENIIVGILVNLIFVYICLKSVPSLERFLGKAGTDVLRKIFGVILLAIAIKIFKSNLHW